MAMTILTFGLVGVISAFAKSADVLRRTQDSIEATSLLKREMGRYEFEAMQNRRLPIGAWEGEFGSEAPDFTWRREVAPAGQDGIVELTIAVIHKRTGRTVTLATYVPMRE